ncbi:MAG TPA: MFS transporter [Thermoplasmata archaeon]|nr:MFS transporter [Thermoplasmata archaeon]
MSSGGPSTTPWVEGERLDPSRARRVLVILSAAALMVTYVETMIIPGLLRFRTFYGNPPYTDVTWILSAYLLVGVAFTPIAGKLGDIYGKKRVLVGLLSVYFVAVTFAGFSPNLGDAIGMTRPSELYLLIGIRAVQGVGMAMFPLAFAMIGEEFPKPEVAQAQGIVSAMFSAGASIGLFGGAWITQTYGWQLTYHTVIPIAAAVLGLTIVYLRESRNRLRQPIDVPGSVFLGGTLAAFLLGLTEGPTWGWTNWSGSSLAGIAVGTPEFFAIAAVLLVAFVLWEKRAALPVVDFRKLAERNILLSNLIGLFAGIAMFLLFVGIVVRAESPVPVGLGKTPLDFGYYSLPTTVVNMIVAPFVGRWVGRRGPKPAMFLGSLLIIAGGFSLTAANDQVIDLILFTIPVLTGTIMLFISMINLVVLSSRPQETGIQTGMNLTFRNLGTSIGPIAGAVILASVLSTLSKMETLPNGTSFTAHFLGPGPRAFALIFAIIGALGIGCLLLTVPIRNFRIRADGTRVATDGAAALPPSIPPVARGPVEAARP